jgi:hypothetical protein
MNSTQDISGLKPRALRGILVCDALMLREGSVGTMRKLTTSDMASGHPTSLVKIKGSK